MVNENRILLDQHISFVQQLRRDSHRKYYAVYDENRLLCATLNFEFIDGSVCERGIISAPHLHGTGRTEKIEKFFNQLLRDKGMKWVRAKVLKSNLRSVNYHLKVGFHEYKQDKDYIYLKYKL